MYKSFLRVSLFLSAAMISVFCFAQDSLGREKAQMADAMRSSGKIYVVVVVLLIILAGLFIYLVNTDRKLTRLEKNGK
jgi:hypothetical protein